MNYIIFDLVEDNGMRVDKEFDSVVRLYCIHIKYKDIMCILDSFIHELGIIKILNNLDVFYENIHKMKHKFVSDEAYENFIKDSKVFLLGPLSYIFYPSAINVEGHQECIKCLKMPKYAGLENPPKLDQFEVMTAQIRYFMIDKMFSADQWTLLSNTQIKKFKKSGFKIECFGSPFNVRMPYFGSMFKSDEPFGRVDDVIGILNQIIETDELKWRDKVIYSKNDAIKLIFSPSTYFMLIFEIFKLLAIIFKKGRKCIVHFGMPADIHNMIQNGIYVDVDRITSEKIVYPDKHIKYLMSLKPIITMSKTCWSYHDNSNMPAKTVWRNYKFSSI